MKSPFDPEVTRAINLVGRLGGAVVAQWDAQCNSLHADRVNTLPKLIDLLELLNDRPRVKDTEGQEAADAMFDEYASTEPPEPPEPPPSESRKRTTSDRRATQPKSQPAREAGPSATEPPSAPTRPSDTSTSTEPTPPSSPSATSTATPAAPVTGFDVEALRPLLTEIVLQVVGLTATRTVATADITANPEIITKPEIITEPVAATQPAENLEVIEPAPPSPPPHDVFAEDEVTATEPDQGNEADDHHTADADDASADDLDAPQESGIAERLPDLLDRAHAALDRGDWRSAIYDFERIRHASRQHWQKTPNSVAAGSVLSACLRGAAEGYLKVGDITVGMQRAQESFDVAGQVNRFERSTNSLSDFIASSITLVLALDAAGEPRRALKLLNTTIHTINTTSKFRAAIRERLAELHKLAAFLKKREQQGIPRHD
jgi:hypothetical protein